MKNIYKMLMTISNFIFLQYNVDATTTLSFGSSSVFIPACLDESPLLIGAYSDSTVLVGGSGNMLNGKSMNGVNNPATIFNEPGVTNTAALSTWLMCLCSSDHYVKMVEIVLKVIDGLAYACTGKAKYNDGISDGIVCTSGNGNSYRKSYIYHFIFTLFNF